MNCATHEDFREAVLLLKRVEDVVRLANMRIYAQVDALYRIECILNENPFAPKK